MTRFNLDASGCQFDLFLMSLDKTLMIDCIVVGVGVGVGIGINELPIYHFRQLLTPKDMSLTSLSLLFLCASNVAVSAQVTRQHLSFPVITGPALPSLAVLIGWLLVELDLSGDDRPPLSPNFCSEKDRAEGAAWPR
jgi:hypothetical protein